MGKIFHVFSILLSVFTSVHTAEATLGVGSGTSKKLAVTNTVMDTVSTAVTALGVSPAGGISQIVSALIDGVVALFNLLGLFKHGAAAPAAATALASTGAPLPKA